MFSSFYAKLSALLLVLLLATGALLAVFGVRVARRYAYEVDQKLNRTLAEELAPRFEPLMAPDSLARGAVQQEIRRLTGLNRRIEIYLLERDGRIKASFTAPGEMLKRHRVDTVPIRAFLRGERLPILGTDPLDSGTPKPFSVATADLMTADDCYLYVVLGSAQEASVARMLDDSYIVRAALVGLGLVLVLVAAVGLALFYRLTRRLNRMTDVVAAFEQGDFRARMPETSDDEIGQLAVCFNQMADTLSTTLADLRRADRLRREFIANVSHDLRSPLAAIQGYLETVLMKSAALEDEARRYVETGLRNAQRLSHMVDQLFEISKLDARAIEPSPEPFALPELAHDLVMQAQPQAEAAGLALRLDSPDRLPRAVADIALVERALSNLLDNALRYTPAGGTVTVACTRVAEAAAPEASVPGDVRVAVRDTGPGIPEAHLPRIFDRFYRVEKSRERTKGGTGLGLAIAQRIMELHGRRLTVRSHEGEGTVFAFALPSEASAAEAAHRAHDAAPRRPGHKAGVET